MAQPIFEEYIGKFQIKAIEFKNLSLGTLPPAIFGESILGSKYSVCLKGFIEFSI